MRKRVFIVHGWDGYPEEGWFPWLRMELEKREYLVSVPHLPNTEKPEIASWVSTLSDAVGTLDEQTFFIGHSLGCQAITRYLESLSGDQKAGGSVFVSGFFKELSSLNNDSDQKTANEWLNAPLDFEKVKRHLTKSIAIFSDNDPYVSALNYGDFKVGLGSEVIITKTKGHYSGDDGINVEPVILNALLSLA